MQVVGDGIVGSFYEARSGEALFFFEVVEEALVELMEGDETSYFRGGLGIVIFNTLFEGEAFEKFPNCWG